MPEVPAQPMGVTSLCFGEYQTVYLTNGSLSSNNYMWMLQPEEAGTIAGSGLTATEIWDEDFTGMAEASVAGVNECGESEMSEVLEVMMNELPIVDLGEDVEVCANETVLLDAGNPGATYLWSTGKTTKTIQVDSTGVGLGTIEISVEVTNTEICLSSEAIMINFYECTGISELADNWKVDVFPNPSNGQFAIELRSKSKQRCRCAFSTPLAAKCIEKTM